MTGARHFFCCYENEEGVDKSLMRLKAKSFIEAAEKFMEIDASKDHETMWMDGDVVDIVVKSESGLRKIVRIDASLETVFKGSLV